MASTITAPRGELAESRCSPPGFLGPTDAGFVMEGEPFLPPARSVPPAVFLAQTLDVFHRRWVDRVTALRLPEERLAIHL